MGGNGGNHRKGNAHCPPAYRFCDQRRQRDPGQECNGQKNIHAHGNIGALAITNEHFRQQRIIGRVDGGADTVIEHNADYHIDEQGHGLLVTVKGYDPQ